MTTPRGSLPDDTRARFDAAMAGSGAALAAARRERDEAYHREGAMGVARLAYVPGGPGPAELAAGYERLAEQARRRRKAAA